VWLGAAVWPALGTSLLALAAATRIRSDRRRLAVALAALALLGLGLAGGRAVMASSASVAAWAERGGALVGWSSDGPRCQTRANSQGCGVPSYHWWVPASPS
jgi:hypothetical protein